MTRIVFALIMMVSAVCSGTSFAEATQTITPTLYVVGVSTRQSVQELNKVSEIIVRLLLEQAKIGDEIAVIDGNRIQQAANFKYTDAVPANNARLKKAYFEKDIERLLLYFRDHQAKEHDGGLELEMLSRYIETRRAEEKTRQVKLLLIGSPIHHDADEFFNGMENGFLPDCVFSVQGPFNVTGRESALTGIDAHWIYLNSPFVNPYHAEMTERFLSLYLSLQGAHLLTLTSDTSAYRRLTVEGLQAKYYEINPNDLKYEVHSVDTLTIPSVGSMTKNPPPPSSLLSRKGLNVFIDWEGAPANDVDLYFRYPGAKEISYKHRKDEIEGKWIRWTKDKANGTEMVNVPTGIEIDLQKIDVSVNLYSGYALKGINGTVYIVFEGKVYSAHFRIRAQRGDYGKSNRDRKTWRKLNLVRIVGL